MITTIFVVISSYNSSLVWSYCGRCFRWISNLRSQSYCCLHRVHRLVISWDRVSEYNPPNSDPLGQYWYSPLHLFQTYIIWLLIYVCMCVGRKKKTIRKRSAFRVISVIIVIDWNENKSLLYIAAKDTLVLNIKLIFFKVFYWLYTLFLARKSTSSQSTPLLT